MADGAISLPKSSSARRCSCLALILSTTSRGGGSVVRFGPYMDSAPRTSILVSE